MLQVRHITMTLFSHFCPPVGKVPPVDFPYTIFICLLKSTITAPSWKVRNDNGRFLKYLSRGKIL